jgi:hypothetical protein
MISANAWNKGSRYSVEERSLVCLWRFGLSTKNYLFRAIFVTSSGALIKTCQNGQNYGFVFSAAVELGACHLTLEPQK